MKEIRIKAVKNSYELGQVFLTPNFDVSNCEFTLSPLVSNEGIAFEEDNIEKFYQKYIEVKEISYIEVKSEIRRDKNGQLGWFPDILLPYEVAVSFRENVISANKNQALVLIFHIPKNQSAGIYKGAINVIVDGELLEFPIEIEVCDIVLPDEQKVDSLLCMEYEFVERAEQDVSLEMKEAYVETLVKYKQAPRLLPQETDTVEDFCKAVREYYNRIPGFSIPMDVAEYWGAPRVMNYDYFQKHVLALAKIALEDGINYFEKVRNYMLVVDEPQQNEKENATSYTCRKYRETLQACADEIEKFDIADNRITKKEIAETIRSKTYNLVTSSYTENITGVDSWLLWYIEQPFVDKKRIYLTGNSMGGYGTWALSMAHPELFAAIVPICGGGLSWNARMLKDIPVWAFHCVGDTTVPCQNTIEMVESVKKYSEQDVKITIYPKCSHDAWTETYQNQEVYNWLLEQKK